MTRVLAQKTRSSLLLWGIALVTMLFLAAIALNVSPYLRGPDEWRWTYARPGKPARLSIPATILTLYLVLVLAWARRVTREPRSSRRHTGTFLACLVMAVPIVQASLMALDHPDVLRPLFYRTVSASASGVFSVGSTIEDVGDFLRRYPALMPTFPVHPQRYPPGLPVLFALTRRLLELFPSLSDGLGYHLRLYQCHDLTLMRLSNPAIGSAIIQMALPLASGLTVLPLYGLARRIYGRSTAAWAAALYPLVPSFALWSARWEQFYPLLACSAWYLFHVGLVDSRRSALLAAGLILSLASMLNFGVLAVLLPMGLSALIWWLTHLNGRYKKRPDTSAGLAAFVAGLASLWIVYRLAFGTGFSDIWRVSMSYHLGLSRDYWTWLVYHLYDFFAFLGLPLALLFIVALVAGIRDLRQRRYDALTLGVASGLILLDISGTSRGEVARVWLFLTPFAALVGARGLARLVMHGEHTSLPRDSYGNLPYAGYALGIIALLMALQLFTFNTFLRVVNTGLTDPPDYARTFTPPAIPHPVDARFQADGAESIGLLGYDLEPKTANPGDTLHLTLYWRALGPMSRAYTVFTHLVGPDRQLAGQQDNMPLQGDAPTTCWIPGQVIADPYDIPVSPYAAPGDYTLETGLYVWETGKRLPVAGPSTTPDRRVILTQVSIGER